MHLRSPLRGLVLGALMLLASNAQAQQVQTKMLVMQPQLAGSITCPSGRICLAGNSAISRPWFVDALGASWPADESRSFYRSSIAPTALAGASYFNTLTNQFLVYAGGIWYEVATTTSAQTLSSKTLGSNLAAGGFRVTGLGAPSSGTDAATKDYVDNRFASGNLVYGTATGGAAGLLGIATLYLRSPGQAGSGTTVTALYRTTRAGVLRNLTCSLGIAPGVANTVVVAMLINGSAVAVTCTMTGAQLSCADNVSTSAVAANSDVAIRAISSAAVASDLTCSAEVTN